MNLQQAFITAFGEFLEAFGQEHGVIVGLRHPKYIMEALMAREIDAEAVSFIPVFQTRPVEPPSDSKAADVPLLAVATPEPSPDLTEHSTALPTEVIEPPRVRRSVNGKKSKQPEEG